MADFVLNFVAMATGVIRLNLIDTVELAVPESYLHATRVMTVTVKIIVKFSHRRRCNFFPFFRINELSITIKCSLTQKALPCAESCRMTY